MVPTAVSYSSRVFKGSVGLAHAAADRLVPAWSNPRKLHSEVHQSALQYTTVHNRTPGTPLNSTPHHTRWCVQVGTHGAT